MCQSPILIDNPNYRGNVGYRLDGSKISSKNMLFANDYLHDIKSKKIAVPCGYCNQCIFKKQSAAIQRVENESLHSYLFMFTLTYNEDMIPRFTTSSGVVFKYAEIMDVYLMFKRIRKYKLFSRPFRRFTVSERGSKRGRPHFHGIISVPKYPDDTIFTPYLLEKEMFPIILSEWRRDVNNPPWIKRKRGDKRNPVNFKPCCTYIKKFVNGKIRCTYDFHYLVPRTENGKTLSDVGFYCTKYIWKNSEREKKLQQALRLNYTPDEYEEYWDRLKSKHIFDNGFGLDLFTRFEDTFPLTNEQARNMPLRSYGRIYHTTIVEDYIRKCVNRSKGFYPYPCWINPNTGQFFPLSNFYRNKYVSMDEEIDFLSFANQLDKEYVLSVLKSKNRLLLEELNDKLVTKYYTPDKSSAEILTSYKNEDSHFRRVCDEIDLMDFTSELFD